MAIVYLWDGGTNTSPYDTWTKAATTYATAAGYMTVASDVIYMAQDHQEFSSSFSMNAASGDSFDVRVRIYSMERTGTTYAPQVTVYNFRASATTITCTNYLDAHGVYFQTADDNITFQSASYFRDCRFDIVNGSAAITFPQYSVLEKCLATGSNANSSALGYVDFYDCRIAHTGSSSRNLASITGPNRLIGGSFGTIPTNALFSKGMTLAHVTHGESLGTRVGYDPADYGNYGIAAFASDQAGASAGRAWRTEFESNAGHCFPTTAIYRDAGWEDAPSETNLAWKMSATNADCRTNGKFLYSPPITSRIEDTGSTTFTAYGVEDFTTGPYQTEFVMHLFYLGTSDSQEWTLATSQGDPEATAALTSDTATWTGASGKTKFKIAQTVTINTPGEWMVQFLLKKYESGKAVWIDPKIEIT